MCSLTTPTKNVRATLQNKSHLIKLNINDDQPGVFNLADSETSGVADVRVELLWKNPKQSLTLILVAPYTERQEAFQVHMNTPTAGSLSKAYQLVDGKEVDISLDDRFLKMENDSNYQVVAKFVPTPGKTDDMLFSYVLAAL